MDGHTSAAGLNGALYHRKADAPEPSMLQPQVHQATGMISVQLGVSTAAALVHLQAYADTHERALTDVADDVIARRLRFDASP